MTEDRKEELEQLLREAIASLEIHPRSANRAQLPSIDVYEYRNYLQQCWTSYSLEGLSVVISYELHILNKVTRFKLLDFIRAEFAPFILADRIQSASYFIAGGPTNGFHLSELLKQLLRISIAYGMERAISDFDKCIENIYASFQDVALLEGIRVETEIQVFEGIRLVPLPNSTSELSHYLRGFSIRLSDIPASSFLGKTLLIIDYSVSPIFHKPFHSTAIQEHPELLNSTFQVEINGDKSSDSYVVDFSEIFFCQALSLVCNSAVQTALKWKIFAEDALFNLSHGMGGYTRTSGPFGNWTKIGEVHINEAKHLYHLLINLNSETQRRLRVPIDRWMESKRSVNLVDKIIDLGIALESLYLLDRDGNFELSFQLRLRASWYLGKDKEHRKELMKDFSRIYDWRSKAVHTGKLPNKTKRKPFTEEEIREFIKKAQNLCRDSIMKILKAGKFPDWNSLILG